MGHFIFNGKSSNDFSLSVQRYPNYNAPAKVVESISVPGRSGALKISTGAFENVPRKYDCFFKGDSNTARAIKMWLLSNSGYARLEDSYDTTVYRMAQFEGPADIEAIRNRFGRLVISFDCKPQLFLKSGEEIITTQVATKTISGNPITVSANANGIKSVKLHGKTTQTGTGDPSPTNIRPIYGVGQYDKKIVLTGSEQSTYGVADYGDNIRFSIVPPNYSVNYTSATTQCFGNTLEASFQKTIGINNTMIINKPAFYCHSSSVFVSFSKSNGILTVTQFKEYLSTHPLTIYYQSTSYATATQVYCGLSITDANGYHGYAAGPMAPLYDGDVLTWSGGSTAEVVRKIGFETLNENSGWVGFFVQPNGAGYSTAPGTNIPNVGTNALEAADSRIVTQAVAGKMPASSVKTAWGRLYISSITATTLDELKSELTNHPVKVIYRLATPTTETVPISEPITNAAGTVTLSAENTLELVYEMLENGFIYNPTEFTALPLIRVYGTAAGTLTVGNTIVQINAISEYVDLDCELQDAFKGITNCNGNVYAPDFPTLPPGGTGISFSGGITKIEIKPRWWTV